MPRLRPAASSAIGRVLVSVSPGATLTSRKNTWPSLTMKSVRDTSRSPRAQCAVTAALATALASAGDTALIERCVLGTEVAVGVIDLGSGPEALPPVEIRPVAGGYDYAARYTPGQTEFHVPARLTAAESKAVTEAAITAHRVLGLRDVSRTDLIVSDGAAFFLEVNVAPGLTETSTLPMALDAAGRSLGTVCRDLLCQAAARGT